MFKKNKRLSNTLLIASFLLLVACGKDQDAATTQKANDQVTTVETETKASVSTEQNKAEKLATAMKPDTKVTSVNTTTEKAQEISWDKLVPADYDPNAVIREYIEKLDKLQDSDQEAMVLYGKIQAELDNAPVNTELDGKLIKMPGFIAPLENNNGVIDEFLLVPYFGACIHSPPPPMNQTVMVKASQGKGVKSEESDYPVWITGRLKAVEERTSIGAAGYRIENPKIEPYEEN